MLILGAGAGGIADSGGGFLGSPVPAYYVFDNSPPGNWPSGMDCQGCPTPCEPTPYVQGCDSNDGTETCGKQISGWKFYKPGPATCHGCQTGSEDGPCTYPDYLNYNWGGYFAWTGHHPYKPLPLVPYYHTSSDVWLHSSYHFSGHSQHTTFSVSGPVRSVDPYSYSIEVQLENTHAIDLIMELTIDAPGQLLISVEGTGTIGEVVQRDSGLCECAGVWHFILPAYHTSDTGLRISVADPSQMQQSYILSGDISPLQAA